MYIYQKQMMQMQQRQMMAEPGGGGGGGQGDVMDRDGSSGGDNAELMIKQQKMREYFLSPEGNNKVRIVCIYIYIYCYYINALHTYIILYNTLKVCY